MKKILFLLLNCMVISTFAQKWTFEYSLGYGTYQLDDVKKLQDDVLKYTHGFGVEETDRFPGYITHNGAIGFNFGNNHLGFNFSYLTTGGRLHRADYSGSYTCDMIMNGYRLGAFYRHYVRTGYAPLNVYLQFSPGVLFSNLKMDENTQIGSGSMTEKITFKSTGAYIEPTIGASYQINQWIQLSIGGGYEADFWGTLKLDGEKSTLKAHWNGLRLYCGLTITLPYLKPN